jgi:tetratricopeptide (TPR) repeat protein
MLQRASFAFSGMSDLSLTTKMKGLVYLILVAAPLIISSACHQASDVASGGAPAMNAPCEIALAAHSGDAKLDREIARIQQEIRSNAKPFRTTAMIEKLGWSFVEKARESFDPGYYKLAEQCALCLESKQGVKEVAKEGEAQSENRPLSDPQSIRSAALLLRGHALQNLHRFSEAEKMARELVETRGLAYDFGLLGDALIEQGKTDEAALAYRKMMETRPGPQAYSRAANLRWLKGDTEGARALMLMSAQSAGETESAAWAWSKLATYELQAGEIKRARAACDAALRIRPDYAPALLALGRVLLAENNASEAVAALERAAKFNPLPEYQWTLAGALGAANRAADAANVERSLAETGQANDPRSYSLFLATRGREPDVALRLAQEELKVRRDIYTLDALAWAQSAKGDAAEAWKTMRSALALGTADARLYLHAAAISRQAGNTAQAKIYAAKAAKLAFSLLPDERIRLDKLNL